MNFPERNFLRALVTLYLGCTGSTSNVERSLKKVATRCERSCNLAAFSDVVICDIHAPRVRDVAHGVGEVALGGVGQTAPGDDQTVPGAGQTAHGRIRIKGMYLEVIHKVFTSAFGGRHWVRAPKQRRDTGLQHHKPDLQGKKSEAEFNRLRDKDEFINE